MTNNLKEGDEGGDNLRRGIRKEKLETTVGLHYTEHNVVIIKPTVSPGFTK